MKNKLKIPTLFMLDTQTMKIHNIFVCNKETPDYLSDYLHIIKKGISIILIKSNQTETIFR